MRGTDPSARRRASGPAAVLGNGSLLATLSGRGEVERLFWPHVDHGQHLGELRLGLARDGAAAWLDEPPLRWRQEQPPRASVLHTSVSGPGVRLELSDLVRPADPVLVRRVRGAGTLVVSCRPLLDGSGRHAGAYVDPGTGAVVFYRRGTALALLVAGVRGEVRSEAEGGRHNAPHDATVAHRPPVAGELRVPLDGEATLAVAFGHDPREALERARAAAGAGFAALERERVAHDASMLAGAGRGPYGDLVARSHLVLAALADQKTGGIVAAPELDDAFASSGGYGFVWPRDLAFVTLGLLAAGRRDLAAPALRWLARHQAPEGLWLHRHWTEGHLAPSWGLHQVDETGAALLAYDAAWRTFGDARLDAELWPSARAAARFLVSFLDPATDLPRPSMDLWEQAEGTHAYTAASTAGGLSAAAALASRHEPELAPELAAAADVVSAAIDAHLWSAEHGRYVRGLDVARADRDGAPVPDAYAPLLAYPNRAPQSVDPVDARVDTALLGLAWPFRAVDPASPRFTATLDAVERVLVLPSGGVLRHERDDYAGGNAWVLCALWLALVRRQRGEHAAYERHLAWAAGSATPLGLLPEQVAPDGSPAWVVPLAWSHALLLAAALPQVAVAAGSPHARLSRR